MPIGMLSPPKSLCCREFPIRSDSPSKSQASLDRRLTRLARLSPHRDCFTSRHLPIKWVTLRRLEHRNETGFRPRRSSFELSKFRGRIGIDRIA